MVNVLLHQPSKDASDAYEDLLHTAGHHPISISASETAYANLTALRDLLRAGVKASGFGGVIITSQRSCEAIAKAFALEREMTTTGGAAQGFLRSW